MSSDREILAAAPLGPVAEKDRGPRDRLAFRVDHPHLDRPAGRAPAATRSR